MIGLGLAAARYLAVYWQCHAMVLATWVGIHPTSIRYRAAPDIADAIATAVASDPSPLWGAKEEAAVMASWAWYESNLRPGAVGDGGKSWGVWQQQRAVGGADLATQARGWLALLHSGATFCDGDPRQALQMVSSGHCDWAGKLVGKRLGALGL